MEDFAGGMSEAYAESWAGMVSNTKAWIGIIGENLLGGVFEQSKDIIAELMGFLKSDEVQQWAKTTGKAINETFAGMIETVKSVIDWWTSLDSNTQKLIGQITLFAVAAGPVISVIGKMTMGVGKLVFNIGKFAGAVKKVGLIGAIVNPGTIVLGVILALIAAGYLLWKNWDAIKAKVNEVFPNLRDQISTSMEHAKNIFTGVVQAIIFIWERVAPVLAVQWEIIKNLFFVAVETIIGVVGGVLRTFSGIIDFLTGVFTGNWELAWQGIVDIFGGIFDGLVALAKAPLNAIIGLINGVITGLNKISLPDWVPGLGGKGVNIPLIPKLATGTLSWPGGIAQVHERGGEIIDLPKGSRVYPHDESVRMARERGRTEASKHISIEKLADTLIVREEADINKIATALVKKLAQAELAYGGDW
ncbi:MAG: hypothetical protein GX963_15230 [Bacteroidales bacterium]|nr:hypothetical protein [Bacteroidales bacterium]